LKRVLKYLIKLCSKIDVSPIGGDTIFKGIIFLVWGINAVLYIGGDYSSYTIAHNPGVTHKVCTYTQSFSPSILSNHNEITFHSSEIGTISSYDVELINESVKKIEHERGPPSSIL
jgi:hypothetical protein